MQVIIVCFKIDGKKVYEKCASQLVFIVVACAGNWSVIDLCLLSTCEFLTCRALSVQGLLFPVDGQQ